MASTVVDMPSTKVEGAAVSSKPVIVSIVLQIVGAAIFAVGMGIMFGLGMGLPGTVLLFVSTPVLVCSVPHVESAAHVIGATSMLLTTMLIRAVQAILGRIAPNLAMHALKADCSSRGPLWGSMLGAYFEVIVTIVAIVHLTVGIVNVSYGKTPVVDLVNRVWKTTARYMFVLATLCGQIIIASAATDPMYGANTEYLGPTVVGIVLGVCALFLWVSKIHKPVRLWLMAIGGTTEKDFEGVASPSLEYAIGMSLLTLFAVLVGFGIVGFLASPAQAAC